MGLIFLVGGRGAGKSTVGRLLAERLGCAFADTDDEIALSSGMDVAGIVAAEGWPGFRAREGAALRRLARAMGGSGVMATGGGMVLYRANRSFMRSCGVVAWLSAPAELLAARVLADGGESRRPSLTGEPPEREMARVLAEREPLYSEAAHVVADASLPAADVAAGVAARVAALLATGL